MRHARIAVEIDGTAVVAFRSGGDPRSDSLRTYDTVEAATADLRERGYRLGRVEPPRAEIWGGPANPPTLRVGVVIEGMS